MRPNDDIDFTTLTWVKGELDETLKQAQQALEAYVEEPNDASQMRFCATYLHQVQGTLRMVELYGAAMVTEEMEQLATALLDGDVKDRDEAYAVLMRGIVQLPDYLERLQSGHKDIPIVLLPLLNDLRGARGEKSLSEIVLFTPDLGRALPASASGPATPMPELELRRAATTLRGHFQLALLKWFKGDDADTHVATLTQVCDKLVSLTSQEEARRLFWVAASVLDALRAKAFEPSPQLKQTIGKVEREIKRLADAGENSFRVDPPRELTRNLLYFVAHAPTEHGRIGELREVFNLSSLLPSQDEIEHARGSMSGHNRALLDTVSAAIKDDLMRVKDALDLYLRTQNAQPADLSSQVDVLDRVSDTLGMLGLGVARRVVVEQRDAVHQVAAGHRPADESTLLDIAGALLYVEATLDDQVQHLGSASGSAPASTGGRAPMQLTETRRVLEAVVKEAQTNFASAKQAFVAFIESNWDHSQLEAVPTLMSEVAGAMRIVELPRPAQFLDAVKQFTQVELLSRRRVPAGTQMETLADVLASLEYFLEALGEHRAGREKILDVAERSLESLGYWPLPVQGAAPTASEQAAVDARVAAAIAGDDAAKLAPANDAYAVEEPLFIAETPLPPWRGDSLAAPVEPPAAMIEAPEPTAADAPAPVAVEAPAPAAPAPIVAMPVSEPVPGGAVMHGFEGASDEIDDEIRDVFIEEVQEEIANLEELLPVWKNEPTNLDSLKSIRRVFHTLKGSGRLVGALTLGEFSWKIESMLNRVLDHSIQPTGAVTELVDHAFNALPELLAALRGQGTTHADLEAIKAVADRVAAGEQVRYAPRPAAAAMAEMPPVVAETVLPAIVADAPALGEPAVEAATASVEPATGFVAESGGVEAMADAPVEFEDTGEPAPAEAVEAIETAPLVAAPEPEPLPAAASIAVPSIDPVLFDILKAEVAGHLETVDSYLDASAHTPQLIPDVLLRAVHTMNGAFAMTDVPVVTDVLGPLEGYFKRLLAHGLVPNANGRAALVDTAAAVRSLMLELEQPQPRLVDLGPLADRIASERDALPEQGAQLETMQPDAPVDAFDPVTSDRYVELTEAVSMTELDREDVPDAVDVDALEARLDALLPPDDASALPADEAAHDIAAADILPEHFDRDAVAEADLEEFAASESVSFESTSDASVADTDAAVEAFAPPDAAPVAQDATVDPFDFSGDYQLTDIVLTSEDHSADIAALDAIGSHRGDDGIAAAAQVAADDLLASLDVPELPEAAGNVPASEVPAALEPIAFDAVEESSADVLVTEEDRQAWAEAARQQDTGPVAAADAARDNLAFDLDGTDQDALEAELIGLDLEAEDDAESQFELVEAEFEGDLPSAPVDADQPVATDDAELASGALEIAPADAFGLGETAFADEATLSSDDEAELRALIDAYDAPTAQRADADAAATEASAPVEPGFALDEEGLADALGVEDFATEEMPHLDDAQPLAADVEATPLDQLAGETSPADVARIDALSGDELAAESAAATDATPADEAWEIDFAATSEAEPAAADDAAPTLVASEDVDAFWRDLGVPDTQADEAVEAGEVDAEPAVASDSLDAEAVAASLDDFDWDELERQTRPDASVPQTGSGQETTPAEIEEANIQASVGEDTAAVAADSVGEPDTIEASVETDADAEETLIFQDDEDEVAPAPTPVVASIAPVAVPAAPRPDPRDLAIAAAFVAGLDDADPDPDGALELADMDEELLDIFLEEGGDLLDHSDALMAKLRDAPDDRESVIGLQRDLHTLKGGARMAGLAPVGDLSHSMESLLEAVAEGRRELPRHGVELLQRAFDRLHGMVTRVGERRALAMPSLLIERVEALVRGHVPELPLDIAAYTPDETDAAVAAPAVETPAFAPVSKRPAPVSEPIVDTIGEEDDIAARLPQEQIRIRADLLDRLVNYAGEVAIYRARLEQQLGLFRGNLSELDQTTLRLREQLRKLEIETEAQIASRYQREAEVGGEQAFDPLELDRFSTLQQLSRALSESAADIVNLQGSLDDHTRQYETLLLQQSRVSSDLQEGLMRTRMVPFDSLVPRLRRIMRQTGTELGKKAQLKVDGAQGEMDRNVLERMTAPLEHMLRNALAHGLETPEDRVAAGKPEEGTVRVHVLREGSEVVIKVSDDGRGLDRDAIRRKAISRGLLAEDVQVSDRDLYAFILEAGFSTAESVSKIAGRGVGMDVVHSEIRQLGGTLQIDSVRGRGTDFTIRLPFTLAVTQAVFVKQGETSFAVPIASVQGVARIDRAELEAKLAAGDPRFVYAGEDFLIHDMGLLLGDAPVKAEGSLQVPLLLARSGDQRAAICVDQVIGSREIVVKPVGPQVGSIPGIFGATIMGDGRVIVILDVAPLVRRHIAQRRPDEPRVVAEPVETRRIPLVMVVDDSITMRKVTSRVLERHSYEVLTAKDGVDAIEKLADRVPDVMLLDIEMPRMDGYELATHMRNDVRLRGVPIIMITSRTGEKHRQRAFEIGVDRYLGKPYQEAELMRNVHEILKVGRGEHA